MSAHGHKADVPNSLLCAVITVSDSRSSGRAEDATGPYIAKVLSEKNEVVCTKVVADEVAAIRKAVTSLVGRVDCIVLTGGTGLGTRDVTIEAVLPILDKELPGFGELFRRLSYEEIGTAAIMSRAVAGISGRCAIFCIPGSRGAVSLAMDIIKGEMYHIVKHVRD